MRGACLVVFDVLCRQSLQGRLRRLGSVPRVLPGGREPCWGAAVQQCPSSCQAFLSPLAGGVKAATHEALESGGFGAVLARASEAEEREKMTI